MHRPIKLTGGKFEAARRWWVSIVQGAPTPVIRLSDKRLLIMYLSAHSRRGNLKDDFQMFMRFAECYTI